MERGAMTRSLAVLPALALAGLLSACVAGGGMPPSPGLPPAPPMAEDACGAAALQGLLGQDAAVLAGLRFRGPMRLIRPGMAVTMDYSAERLNISLNDAGRIDRVACG